MMFKYEVLETSLIGVHLREPGEIVEMDLAPEKVGPNLRHIPDEKPGALPPLRPPPAPKA